MENLLCVYICITAYSDADFQYLISPWNGKETGPRLNIKTVLSTYGDFHVKD